MHLDDTLVIWKLFRPGKSLKELIETVQCPQDKSVEMRSLHKSIDTNTATGNMIENTTAGMVSARARRKIGGRKPALDAKKRILACY